jgi:hypothetical protein
MKFKIRSIVIAAVMALLSLAPNVHAQPACPDASGPSPDPALYPWNSSSTIQTIPGTSCSITIYYCERKLSDGSIQIWISEIDPTPGPDCDGVSNIDMIQQALALAPHGLSTSDLSSLCTKGQTTVVSVIQATCWKSITKGTSYALVPCTEVFYCSKTCNACWGGDPITLQITNCSTVGGNVDYECTTPAPGGIWPRSNCYEMGCTGNGQ